MRKLFNEYLWWRQERADEKRDGVPLGYCSGPNPILRALRLK